MQTEPSPHKNEALFNAIREFPDSPGVYIMKNSAGKFLYIGKAVNLKSRVRSYFLDTHADRIQIPHMLRLVADIEWIATNTESEALILEANLIRSHQPPYNISLKDDKHYPYLKITITEPFPRICVVRKVAKDGAKYFGPYTDATAMRSVLEFVKKLFRLRNCLKSLPLNRPARTCINYAIKRCCGPCAGNISEEEYRHTVHALIQFLKGRRRDVIALLKSRMEEAAAQLRFENAACIRDQIALITRTSNAQRVDCKTPDADFDVFGIYETDRRVCLCVLSFIQGLLMSKRQYVFKKEMWEGPFADHDAVLLQYYQNSLGDPPREIILPQRHSFTKELIASWFDRQLGVSVTVTTPRKGNKLDLVLLAEKNARYYLAQREPVDYAADLAQLENLLHLPRFPATIEAFDISNLGEKYAVAGMVCFTNGIPVKSRYRRFAIKTVSGQNDFAMMMEVVHRRLTRLTNEAEALPDCLLIDGGPGQLSSAQKALSEFEQAPMIIALAKKEETLFSPYTPGPVKLPPHHPVRKLVERIRNEVHRFAVSYHRTLRDKQMKKSSLEKIPGLGKNKALLLLRHFGSVKRISQASVEDIATIKGFSVPLAEKILSHLGNR